MASVKDQGHAAHTQDMEQVSGLSGVMPRPIKLTMLGAGSPDRCSSGRSSITLRATSMAPTSSRNSVPPGSPITL